MSISTFRNRTNYERDDDSFPADAYQASGWQGIAWSVLGWETEPTEETVWSGYEERTGKVVAIMIGDDRPFTFEPDDLTPIDETQYCHSCGQIGCPHNAPGDS